MWSEYIGTNNQQVPNWTHLHTRKAPGAPRVVGMAPPQHSVFGRICQAICTGAIIPLQQVSPHPSSSIDPLNVSLVELKPTFLRPEPGAFGPLFLVVVSRRSTIWGLLVNIEALIVFCLDNVPARALALFRRLVITDHYALARFYFALLVLPFMLLKRDSATCYPCLGHTYFQRTAQG